MAVTLSTTSGSVLSEYAAQSTTFNRSMQPDSQGHLQAVFSATIQYSRTDFLVDAEGNKLNVIQRTIAPGAAPFPAQDPYTGFISLSQAQLLALSPGTATSDILGAIAAAEDSLIHADLVTRGILAAPAAS